jgi:hypothetical protein
MSHPSPVDRSAEGAKVAYVYLPDDSRAWQSRVLGRIVGFEPTTAGATVRCSTTELYPPCWKHNRKDKELF